MTGTQFLKELLETLSASHKIRRSVEKKIKTIMIVMDETFS